jgi:anti-sigma regulatory factor (Ser/Thr protein kinase)
MSVVGFEHEALLYEGMDGFLDGVVPFVREGVDAGEAVMVAVDAEKTARMRSALGEDAEAVHFVPMERVGRNPGRIIPGWMDFADANPGALRGVGEPIWAGRTADELVECQLHESLLNVAFADTPGMRLLCPYDVTALGDAVIHEARCSHGGIVEAGGVRSASHRFRGTEDPVGPFAAPLPRPPTAPEHLSFDRRNLAELRAAVGAAADQAGLDPRRRADLVLAVSEIAANSLIHGGGHGLLRIWPQDGGVVCEVRDRGVIEDSLVGRRRPGPDQIGGWGVWIAHQICDLVQLRTGPEGTIVRLHAFPGS